MPISFHSRLPVLLQQAAQNKWGQLLPSYAFFWWASAPHGLLSKLIEAGMSHLHTKYAKLAKTTALDDPDTAELGFAVWCSTVTKT